MTIFAGESNASLLRGDIETRPRQAATQAGSAIAGCWPLLCVLALAMLLASFLPLGAPWWVLIDSDGTYVGSALNLLLGRPTRFLDHPAVSLQQLLSWALLLDFGIRSLGSDLTLATYVDDTFADMNRVVPIVRVFGMAFLLFGVTAAYEVVRRLWGNRQLAAVAALLYLAVPGHVAKSLNFRPENVQSGLCLIVTYLLIRGRQTRRSWYYVVAAALFGVAVGVKVHAIALVLLFVLAMVDRPRWDFAGALLDEAKDLWSRRAGSIVLACALAWVMIVVSNVNRTGATIDWKLLGAGGGPVVYLLTTLVLRRSDRRDSRLAWVFSPVVGIMVLAAGFGFFGPPLAVMDMLRPLAWRFAGLFATGPAEVPVTPGGLFEGLKTFGTTIGALGAWPLVVLCLAAVVVEVRARARQNIYWLVAAGAMLSLAVLRGASKPSVHYLAPTLALLIPVVISMIHAGAIELAGRRTARRPVVLGCGWLAVTAVVIWPYFLTRLDSHQTVRLHDSIAKLAARYVDTLEAGQVVMMNYGALNEEAFYFMLLREYCDHTPQPLQRCYPDTPTALEEMDRLELTPKVYIIGGAGKPEVTQLADGRAIANSAWGGRWYVRKTEVTAESNGGFEVYHILGPV